MFAKPDRIKVKSLINLKKNGMLIANPEYQRGSVWSKDQKKRLIDSLFRQYPLPLIYLHKKRREIDGFINDGLEVIDGQQRTNALFEYSEGSFKLFDPVKDAAQARFPSFLLNQECQWGGLDFDSLSESWKERFLETELSVVYIETELDNEARDLFIRLQAGLPLNAQEKRDAWPGQFTEFVLKIGGKPEILKYPGHEFFPVAMKTKANSRGEVRQLTAQMYMLFNARRITGHLCDIKRDSIDDFYYQNLNFDLQSTDAKRFDKILTILAAAFKDGKRKKIQGHEAIGLVLLVDTLLEGYAASWQDHLAHAFDSFREKLALASETRWDAQPDEYWSKYGVPARTNSDQASSIEKRHEFFMTKMYEALQPRSLDSNRIFGPLEREIIYYRDQKKCQVSVCGGEVLWDDAEIHHVDMHSKGGTTILSNGALVHKMCHPKGVQAVAAFADSWKLNPKLSSNPAS